MNLNNYVWLDSELFEQGKKALQSLVEMMKRNGGSWRTEWLNLIVCDRRNEIYRQVFDEVCLEYGFEKKQSTLVSVEPVMVTDHDQAVIARAETKKRLSCIFNFYDELKAGSNNDFPSLSGWLIRNYEITQHLEKLISIENGTPSLRKDWEKQLKQLCTHQIPEEYQALCRLFKDNEKPFITLVNECAKLNIFEKWEPVFEGGNFSLENFGSWLLYCFHIQ